MTFRGRYGFIKPKRTIVDGKEFPSSLEAKRYSELLILLKAKVIKGLELQPQYSLDVNGVHICNYRPDFRYMIRVASDENKWHTVIEDVKGIVTDIYRLKKRLMLACHDIDVIEPKVRY